MSEEDIFKDGSDNSSASNDNQSGNSVKQSPQNTEKEQELRQSIQALKEKLNSAEKELSRIAPLHKKQAVDLEGEVYYGQFNGENMVTEEGKVFAVPPNYASKSKMVEGDELKLTITPSGDFIFKQIRPAERKRQIGVLAQQDNGEYVVKVGSKPYKVLLASVTYYRAKTGDEVAIIVPANNDSNYAAFDSVVSGGQVKSGKLKVESDGESKSLSDTKYPASDATYSSKTKGKDDSVGTNLSDSRLGSVESDEDRVPEPVGVNGGSGGTFEDLSLDDDELI